jgi:hypothetical protein
MFSKNEWKIIKLIAGKRITIRKLTDKFYGKKQPIDGNNRVAGFVRRISSKCKHNKLGWVIDGEGMGRGGRTVWRTKASPES